jgi:alpha-glucuronidase
MDNGRLFWDELVLRYQTGVQYVTWMREAWDALEGRVDHRRFAEVRAKLAQHEVDAADWRDTSVGYWRTFSNRPIPTDGPLAIEITVGGKRFGGFDASAASYEIPVAGPITKVRTKPGARYRILEQTRDRAVVQVRGRSFFGPIVKNYVFEMSSR